MPYKVIAFPFPIRHIPIGTGICPITVLFPILPKSLVILDQSVIHLTVAVHLPVRPCAYILFSVGLGPGHCSLAVWVVVDKHARVYPAVGIDECSLTVWVVVDKRAHVKAAVGIGICPLPVYFTVKPLSVVIIAVFIGHYAFPVH